MIGLSIEPSSSMGSVRSDAEEEEPIADSASTPSVTSMRSVAQSQEKAGDEVRVLCEGDGDVRGLRVRVRVRVRVTVTVTVTVWVEGERSKVRAEGEG